MRPLAEHRRGPVALKALYSDLDGTLVGPGGTLFATSEGPTTRAAEALAALQSSGVSLVLVSGRTRDQMREAARLVSASASIAELGAFIVERGLPEEVTECFGAFEGPGRPFDAMARSGAGALLLERYAGRLEMHTPWTTYQDREATMLFRGLLDAAEATGALTAAGYRWLEVVDNGVLARTYESLDVPEVHLYHLVPRGVSKAAAVRIHREHHGLSPEETAAVGDSLSDLQLAGEVRALFIPANGLAGIGAAADGLDNVYATPSPSGAGFADAVEALLGSTS